MLIIPLSASLVNMGYVDRYFFPGMTLFIVAYMSFVGMLVIKIVTSINKKAVSVIVALFLVGLLSFLDWRSNAFAYGFQFRDFNDKEILAEVSGKDVYVVINYNRDLVYFSPILCESNNIFIDYQSSFDEEDFTVPELGPDCVLMIVGGNLMTEEQKSEFLADSTFTVNGLMKPDVFKTLNDIIDKIETDTGNSYEEVDTYNNFLGEVSIFRGVGSST